MCRYIVKLMCLEKSKHLIIWNGGSSFHIMSCLMKITMEISVLSALRVCLDHLKLKFIDGLKFNPVMRYID